MTNIIDSKENNQQIIFKENLSKNPYFDDFTNESPYYKILFREDRPLQTRELNQFQSILQKQIERLGSVIFKNGSIISGCDNKIILNMNSASLESFISELNLEKFLDTFIISLNDSSKIGKIGKILHSSKNTIKEESLIFYESVSGGLFDNTDEICIYDQINNQKNLNYRIKISESRKASLVFFNEGVLFVNGYFLFIHKQNQIIDAYSNTPSKSLGFSIEDSIVTFREDESLFDNAYFEEIEIFSNSKALGADRYKIVGTLEVRNSLKNDNFAEQSLSGNFFEFIRIENGVIVKNVKTTIYSELEKILARRTFDESGSYTVRPFSIKVKKSNQNLKNFSLEISPGKAYVLGYEFESIANRTLEIPRALDYDTKESFDFSLYYGSYIKLKTFSGFFDVQKCSRIYLCNKISSDITIPSENDIIGTARVKHCKKLGDLLFVYLFDIKIDKGTFENVKSVRVQFLSEGTGIGDLDTFKLFEANNSSFVYKLNNHTIRSLESASYSYQKSFIDQKFIENEGTSNLSTILKVSSSEQLSSSPLDYLVVNKSTKQYLPISKIQFLDENGQSCSIEISDQVDEFLGDVLAIVDIKNASSRKAIKQITTKVISFSEINQLKPNQFISISGVFLGFKLLSLTNNNSDIVNLFELVNNEDDNYFSEIQLKYIGKDNLKTDISLNYSFLDFNVSGYFDLNSFTPTSDIIVPDISLSNNISLNRNNCLDFRPVKNSRDEILNAIIPNPSGTFECSYSFYLSRIDKIVITSAKTFEIVSGTPGLSPNVPPESEEKMTLYSIFIPAGTDNPNLVKLTFFENKRYTMRDIGKLEQRIKSLEYYTALTLLEKDVESFEIKDTSGNNRFKNGFLIDNFKNFKSLDYANSDVKCSFDLKKGLLRPSFDMMNIKGVFNQEKSNAILAGELILLPYQTIPYIQQLQCSEILNLQPFEVFSWDGSITLDPEIDEWVDTETKPDVTVNQFDEQDIWETLGASAFNVEWGSWETRIVQTDPELPLTDQTRGDFANITTTEEMRLWNPSVDISVGETVIAAYNDWINNDFQAGFEKTTPDGFVNGQPAIFMPFKSATELTVRTGESLAFDNSKIINNSLGEKVISTEVTPFIRAQTINFSAKNLKPNTRVFAFFDNKPISELCFQNSRYYPGLLKTDEKGKISGIFKLPGGIFNCGTRFFRICDDENNNSTFITTVCERKFTANGLNQTKQETILSTREPQLVAVTVTSIDTNPKSVFAWGNIAILPTPTPTPTPSTSRIPVIPPCSITASAYDPVTRSATITSNGTWGIFENSEGITVTPTWGVSGDTTVVFSGELLGLGGIIVFKNTTLNCQVSVQIPFPDRYIDVSDYDPITHTFTLIANCDWESTPSEGLIVTPAFGKFGIYLITISGPNLLLGGTITFKLLCGGSGNGDGDDDDGDGDDDDGDGDDDGGGGDDDGGGGTIIIIIPRTPCVLELKVPYNATTKKLTLTSNSEWTSSSSFAITATPEIGVAGDTEITLSGTNLVSGSSVTFHNTLLGCEKVVSIPDPTCNMSVTTPYNTLTKRLTIQVNGNWTAQASNSLILTKLSPPGESGNSGVSGTYTIIVSGSNIDKGGNILFRNTSFFCETTAILAPHECIVELTSPFNIATRKLTMNFNGAWSAITSPGIIIKNAANTTITSGIAGTFVLSVVGQILTTSSIIFTNTAYNCQKIVELTNADCIRISVINSSDKAFLTASSNWSIFQNLKNVTVVPSEGSSGTDIELTFSNIPPSGATIIFKNNNINCRATLIIPPSSPGNCRIFASVDRSNLTALLTSTVPWEVFQISPDLHPPNSPNNPYFGVDKMSGDAGEDILLTFRGISEITRAGIPIEDWFIIVKAVSGSCQYRILFNTCSITGVYSKVTSKITINSDYAWDLVDNTTGPKYTYSKRSGLANVKNDFILITNNEPGPGVAVGGYVIGLQQRIASCNCQVTLTPREDTLTAEYNEANLEITLDSSWFWKILYKVSGSTFMVFAGNTNTLFDIYSGSAGNDIKIKVIKCIQDTTIRFMFRPPGNGDYSKYAELIIPKFTASTCALTAYFEITTNKVHIFSITKPWKLLSNPKNIILSATTGPMSSFTSEGMAIPQIISLSNLPNNQTATLTFATTTGTCQRIVNIPKTVGVLSIQSFYRPQLYDDYGRIYYTSNGPVILQSKSPASSTLTFNSSEDFNIRNINVDTRVFLKNTTYNLVKSYLIRKPCILEFSDYDRENQTIKVTSNARWYRRYSTDGTLLNFTINPPTCVSASGGVQTIQITVGSTIAYYAAITFEIFAGNDPTGEKLCTASFTPWPNYPPAYTLSFETDLYYGRSYVKATPSVTFKLLPPPGNPNETYKPDLDIGTLSQFQGSITVTSKIRCGGLTVYTEHVDYSVRKASCFIPGPPCQLTVTLSGNTISIKAAKNWKVTPIPNLILSSYSGFRNWDYAYVATITIESNTLTVNTNITFEYSEVAGCKKNLLIPKRTGAASCQTDPLAQTFMIESSEYPEGVFITAIDLFFKTKSESRSVKLELRQTVNGFPHSSEYIPFAQKIVDPEDINISNDASIPTHIAFDTPIFLQPGEFAFCVISDSSEYNVFTAKLGNYQLGAATERIDKNAYSGVLFKSANASSWIPQPDMDFKFVIYRASFLTNQDVSVNIVNAVPEEALNFSYNSLCFNAMTIKPSNTQITTPSHNLIQQNMEKSERDYVINFNESSELDNTFIIKELN